MASSGTVSAPAIDLEYKPEPLRETVILLGKLRVKSSAVIEAGDLSLRTIKSIQLTPYASEDQVGAQQTMYGSINTSGSLMNSVTIKSLRGSQDPVTGTTHVGTIAGGTMQASFQILGA